MRTLQFDNKNILTHFKEGKLELAAKAIEEFQMNLGEFDFVLLIDYFKTQIKLSLSEGEIREATRFKRRLAAIIILRDYGFDSRKLIPELILPEGYKGKIILISISGGLIEPMVCLRSGDLWHREILREVEEEIKDIGLVSTFVYEIGGGHICDLKTVDLFLFGEQVMNLAHVTRKSLPILYKRFIRGIKYSLRIRLLFRGFGYNADVMFLIFNQTISGALVT